MKGLGNRKSLDDSRDAFCRAIMNLGVGVVQAYKDHIDPHATDRQALTMGALLCEEDAVKDRLLYLKENRAIIRNLDKNTVLAEVTRIATVSPIDYYNEDWTAKSPREWTSGMKKACKAIKPTKNGIEIQTIGKDWCIDTINKMQGYVKDERNVIEVTSKFEKMSDKELAEYAEFTEIK